jgi:steroid delta-isomerase-like uncharacterized protein
MTTETRLLDERFLLDLVAAWNSHDVEQVAVFYTPEYEGVDVGQAAPHHGVDGLRHNFRHILSAFPDARFEVQQMLIQGANAALVWVARGTHQGSFWGIPPTQRQVAVRGVTLLKVERAKVRHAQYIWDVAGLLRAIGLLPKL